MLPLPSTAMPSAVSSELPPITVVNCRVPLESNSATKASCPPTDPTEVVVGKPVPCFVLPTMKMLPPSSATPVAASSPVPPTKVENCTAPDEFNLMTKASWAPAGVPGDPGKFDEEDSPTMKTLPL